MYAQSFIKIKNHIEMETTEVWVNIKIKGEWLLLITNEEVEDLNNRFNTWKKVFASQFLAIYSFSYT